MCSHPCSDRAVQRGRIRFSIASERGGGSPHGRDSSRMFRGEFEDRPVSGRMELARGAGPRADAERGRSATAGSPTGPLLGSASKKEWAACARRWAGCRARASARITSLEAGRARPSASIRTTATATGSSLRLRHLLDGTRRHVRRRRHNRVPRAALTAGTIFRRRGSSHAPTTTGDALARPQPRWRQRRAGSDRGSRRADARSMLAAPGTAQTSTAARETATFRWSPIACHRLARFHPTEVSYIYQPLPACRGHDNGRELFPFCGRETGTGRRFSQPTTD